MEKVKIELKVKLNDHGIFEIESASVSIAPYPNIEDGSISTVISYDNDFTSIMILLS